MSNWLKDPTLGLVRSVRSSQVKMAEHVQDVIENGGFACIQAGTGTGKSFAYLAPALESGKRIVVATAKKTLQSQLFAKDLPHLTKTVKHTPFASLKGKANYACMLRAEQARDASHLDEYNQDMVARFMEWVATDPSGDFANFPETVPFEYLTRVNDCMKTLCPHTGRCGYVKTRLAAKDAKILVVNHALLAYDLQMGNKILGEYDVLIVDEAHQFPSFARKAYAYEIFEKQAEHIERAFQEQWDIKVSTELKGAFRAFFRVLEKERPGEVKMHASVERAAVDLVASLDQLKQQCKKKGYSFEGPDEGVSNIDSEVASRGQAKIAGVTLLIGRLINGLNTMLGVGQDEEAKTEYVTYTVQKDIKTPLRLNIEPVEVGPLVAPALIHINKCVFTSATLSSGDGFGYFLREVGLSSAQVRIQSNLPSPFQYKARSALWVSPEIPLPARDQSNKEQILEKKAQEIHVYLKASAGGAFVISPSYAEMNWLYDRVNELSDCDRLPSGDRYYHLLRQVSTNIDAVVSDFKSGYNNVLFGVKAISEGVDVPGMKLRMVIVTGLCFPHYEDVLNKKRKELVKRRLMDGGEPEGVAGMKAFDRIDVQLAGFELAQSAGRLIRTENDFGVLVLLDPRMHDRAKNYSSSLRRLIPHPPCSKKEDLMKIIHTIRGIAMKEESCSS